jgi:beta-lactamase class A
VTAADPAALEALCAEAGCRGFVHAVSLDTDREVGLDPDAPVVPASTIKVLVALEAERAFLDGRLDPAERVRVTDANRTTGPVGLSLHRDDVEMSVGDLVVPMLTFSDNVATDLLIGRLGLEALARAGDRLGLTGTRIDCDLRALIDSVAVDAGFADWAAVEATDEDDAAVLARVRAARALRADVAPIRTTARDLTTVLRAAWEEDAGLRVRFLMARQVGKDRIARGFGDDSRVAAKSGSLFRVWRNEVGVVTRPDGRSAAVAVLLHTPAGDVDDRTVNDAIAKIASRAVDAVLGSSA